jgi:uncharacterized protein YjbI with pentapeptide repeats
MPSNELILPTELERIVAAHELWVSTGGCQGQHADLADMDLRGADLNGRDLTGANFGNSSCAGAVFHGAKLSRTDFHRCNLQEANLRGVDLTESDLQEAILTNADLTGASLVRAKIYGSKANSAILSDCNLSGLRGLENLDWPSVDLKKARGILAEDLKSLDLSGASLPDDISKFRALDQIVEVQKGAQVITFALMGACAYSWLMVATSKDADLLLNGSTSPLPIIQTPVPLATSFVVFPIILIFIYCYSLLYLRNLWSNLASLPTVFPDGRTVDDVVYPSLVNVLLMRSAAMSKVKPIYQFSLLQQAIVVVSVWFLVPATIGLFWLRYLARHEAVGSVLQLVILASSTLLGLLSYRNALEDLGANRLSWILRWLRPRGGIVRPIVCFISLAGVLLFIAFGSFYGRPTYDYELTNMWLKGQIPEANRIIPFALSSVGFAPFLDLRGAELSKPGSGVDSRDKAKGASLKGMNLRFADLTGAFLAHGDLEGADLQGAKLFFADLTSARLFHADFRGAVLNRADLDSAMMVVADLRDADLNGATLKGADLELARRAVQRSIQLS